MEVKEELQMKGNRRRPGYVGLIACVQYRILLSRLTMREAGVYYSLRARFLWNEDYIIREIIHINPVIQQISQDLNKGAVIPEFYITGQYCL